MAVPKELGPRGRRLWRSIAARDPKAVDVGDPRRDVALEACRAGDQLDLLAGILAVEGLTVRDFETGKVTMHPALAATDRLRPIQARLIVALRLPDEVTGAKPQHRGVRGTYAPAATKTKVSALDRARAAAAA